MPIAGQFRQVRLHPIPQRECPTLLHLLTRPTATCWSTQLHPTTSGLKIHPTAGSLQHCSIQRAIFGDIARTTSLCCTFATGNAGTALRHTAPPPVFPWSAPRRLPHSCRTRPSIPERKQELHTKCNKSLSQVLFAAPAMRRPPPMAETPGAPLVDRTVAPATLSPVLPWLPTKLPPVLPVLAPCCGCCCRPCYPATAAPVAPAAATPAAPAAAAAPAVRVPPPAQR